MKLIGSRRQTISLKREKKIGGFLWILLILVIGIDVLFAYFFLFSQSIRLDEAQSLWVSTRPIAGIVGFVSQDVSAPLYPILLHFWIQIFGQSIFMARLLSFIFFLFTIPVLYILAEEASNRRVAIVTIMLFALSPFIIWYTSEARMYTLFTFITSLNHVFFFQLVRTKGTEGKSGYVFTTILGLFTHYFFLFLIISQVVFVCVQWAYRAYINREHLARNFLARMNKYKVFPIQICTLLLLSLLFFEPWFLYFFLQGAASNTQPLIPTPTAFNVFQTFVNFLFGFQPSVVQTVLISLWPLAIIVLFFTFTQQRYTSMAYGGYFILATFFPIILDFLGSYVKPIFLSRYLILTTPTLFFLIAWLLLSSEKRLSALLTSGLIMAMFALLVYQNISATTPVKENYQSVSAYLKKYAKPQDIIVVSAPFTVYPIEYTYTGTDRIETIPYWDQYAYGPIPQFSLQNLSKQVIEYTHAYNNMFVVLSYNQGYQPAITTYLDGHYQRKTVKYFSPGLEVREYQLRYP